MPYPFECAKLIFVKWLNMLIKQINIALSLPYTIPYMYMFALFGTSLYNDQLLKMLP